jgi:hypothetical protein
MRVYGGGDIGNFLDVACVPDATLATAITALIAAGTKVDGKLVCLTYLNDYEVKICPTDTIPDGEIIAHEGNSISGYTLTVRFFHYVDQNATHRVPSMIKTFGYGTKTIALGDTIQVDGSDYMYVEDATSGGIGAVIAKNTTALTVDVIM